MSSRSPPRNRLQDIFADVATSREHALLGNYDQAAAYFKGAISDVERQLRSASGAEAEVWTRVKEDLAEEARLVEEVSSQLRKLGGLPGGSGEGGGRGRRGNAAEARGEAGLEVAARVVAETAAAGDCACPQRAPRGQCSLIHSLDTLQHSRTHALAVHLAAGAATPGRSARLRVDNGSRVPPPGSRSKPPAVGLGRNGAELGLDWERLG